MGNQWQSRSKTHTSIPAAPVSKGVSWRRPFPEQNTHVQPKSDDKADEQAYRRRPPSNAMSRLDSSLDLPHAMKPIQTKLTVGAPGDKYEQEADRVADQVMRMPDAAIQQPVQRETAPEEEELQTKPIAASITPLVQREMAPEEEEVQPKLAADSIQREEIPEEEEIQTKPIAGMLQREEMPEEEEMQTKPIASIQREEMPEEEIQTKPIAGMLQREEMPEEEEIQTKPIASIQREETQEEEVQTKPLGNIQREEMPEEEEIQTKPIASIQREEMPEEEEVQTKPSLQRSPDGGLQAGGNLESRLSSSKGGGSALPDEVRSFMEPRFGANFSQVRVHTGSEAVQMNRDLSAQAFTHQQDVYFGAGKVPAKDALTAHELTHVVQQTSDCNSGMQPFFATNSTYPHVQKAPPENKDEAERIRKLHEDYENEVNKPEANWSRVAELLNGFNDTDIQSKLKNLQNNAFVNALSQLRKGAIQGKFNRIVNAIDKFVGPGPGTGPVLISSGMDAINAVKTLLPNAMPIMVSSSLGNVELKPGTGFDSKLLIYATTLSVYYIDGINLYQAYTPDFVRDLWLTAFAQGAATASWLIPIAKAEMEFCTAFIAPWYAVLGKGIFQAIVFYHENRDLIWQIVNQIQNLNTLRKQLQTKFPTLYNKVLWSSLKAAIVNAPEGIEIGDIAYLIGRILGYQGLLGKTEAGIEITQQVCRKIIFNYVALVSLLHAPGIIGRGIDSMIKQQAIEFQKQLNDAGVNVTIEDTEKILQEMKASPQGKELIQEIQTKAGELQETLDKLKKASGK